MDNSENRGIKHLKTGVFGKTVSYKLEKWYSICYPYYMKKARDYKRWAFLHIRTERLFKIRFVNPYMFWILRLDIFKHSVFVIYRKNALQDYYEDISYGYL